MNDDLGSGAIKCVALLAALLLSIVGLGGLLVYGMSIHSPGFLWKPRPRFKYVAMLGLMLISAVLLCSLQRSHRIESVIYLISAIWLVSSVVTFEILSKFPKLIRPKFIRARHLRRNGGVLIAPDTTDSIYESQAFIGRSMLTGENVFLDERDRSMHVLVSGSTGSGKTTILKALFKDAVAKHQPVLLIDPKGNQLTIDELKAQALLHGLPEERFNVFSLISPSTSARYNPLLRGSAVQIRDRLMGAFEWSEPFYKHQASSWLGIAIECLKGAGLDVTIRRLHKLLRDKKEFESLEETLRLQETSIDQLEYQTRLRQLARFDKENLEGLQAQLRDLDNLDFGDLFDTSGDSPTIDLRELINLHGVAYFQLNTMAYESAARVVGRLVLQDLKALASQVHGGLETIDSVFFPIFIDEFGSFAFEGFIDFLKMSRDVRFSNHLFFQSLADLDVVSPEFKSQVQQNCLTKIIMRTDDPDEVDFWAGVAGTDDCIESSFQVEDMLGFKMKTGQGNARASKQMLVEHDVFKKLMIGQAVKIRKSPSQSDLIQLWLTH